MPHIKVVFCWAFYFIGIVISCLKKEYSVLIYALFGLKYNHIIFFILILKKGLHKDKELEILIYFIYCKDYLKTCSLYN